MKFTHRIEKSKEGLYYTIPFDVPENTEKFTVSYSYAKHGQGLLGKSKKANIVDFGLINADGAFVGWSGSAKDSISVGEYGSSPGFFSQKIKAGTWQIIVGAYKIFGDYTDVEYTVIFEEKKSRFFYGDLHVHTTASDGQFSAFEIGRRAKEKGLDFVATADHNNYSENFSLPRIDGITFIPAVEWTHYKGHMNFFGVRAPFENSFIANSLEEMHELIKKAKELGAIISVNHPECDVCPYLWGDDDVYDMMEIWNGPMRSANLRAIKKWTELLKAGRKIPAVGGSDYHRVKSPVRLGNPVNGVFSPDASVTEILDSVKSGHLFIASNKKIPSVFLRCGDKICGDTVKSSENSINLKIETSSFGKYSVILVTDKDEEKVTSEVQKIEKGTKFAYAKILNKSGILKAITNPVYFDWSETK